MFEPNYCDLELWRRGPIVPMPRGKSPGADAITVELLQACESMLYTALARRFLRYLAKYEPKEPAGFWRKFSTLDRIITSCRLIETAREYQEPLGLTFIDYEKAFDSVEPAKVWKALEKQGVEMRYTKVLSGCYLGCTTVFRPFLDDIEVGVEKGVHRGNPVPPNLFSACSESVIRNCDSSILESSLTEYD
ncbi:hypothetical protein ANCDUO_05187 [Ancylostoma duodenale]|uniref:Uncharacterized protein n=1 Tax=Ancylostoma duodenale TaxID=51022 RepID=A0A0C2DP96_9BILA|nr:hypothetical protein ANCDUO_05187 [Ancylostoma duodenale]